MEVSSAFKNTKGGWDWAKIMLPILIPLILAPFSILYSQQNEKISKKADQAAVDLQVCAVQDAAKLQIMHLQTAVESKVDNKVLAEMLKTQAMQQEMLRKQFERQQQQQQEQIEILAEMKTKLAIIDHKLENGNTH